MTVLYRNREGEPITQEEWARLFEIDSYKIVMRTEMGDIKVSTVWLGLIHPNDMFFETMIFGGEYDQQMWRYRSEEGAQYGHVRILQALIEGREP